MDGLTSKELHALDAIRHAMRAICDDPAKFYLLGALTGTWDKLTASYAELCGLDVLTVRKSFQPNKSRYQDFLDQREEERELLIHCRENGITLPKEGEE